MKVPPLCLALCAAITLGSAAIAQDRAPESLAGKSAVVVVSEGPGRTSVTGYKIIFSAANATYAVTPISSDVPASAGTYVYVKTGASSARFTLTDTTGAVTAHTLAFNSPCNATDVIVRGSSSQSATLFIENVLAWGSAGPVNMSVRGQASAAAPLIAGLVVDVPCKVLIRAAGPALAAFGVSGTLPNPRLTLMAGNLTITSNDDWASNPSSYDSIRAAAEKCGAFEFNFGSRDSAVVLDLTPGAYTCLVRGEGTTSGEVLLEVYRVP